MANLGLSPGIGGRYENRLTGNGSSSLPTVDERSEGLRLSQDAVPEVHIPQGQLPGLGSGFASNAIWELHYCNVRYAQARLLRHYVVLGMHGAAGDDCKCLTGLYQDSDIAFYEVLLNG